MIDAARVANSLRNPARSHSQMRSVACIRRALVFAELGIALAMGSSTALAAPSPVALGWLGNQTPTTTLGATWGVPWPQGAVSAGQFFSLKDANGANLPLQTWPLAYWPDGSIKWTACATVAGPAAGSSLTLSPSAVVPPPPATAVLAVSTSDTITVSVGALECKIARQGADLIESIAVGGVEVARHGRLVCLLQNAPDADPLHPPSGEEFESKIQKATIEQAGPVRATIKVSGVHRGLVGGREWLPFSVRLYFYAGTESIRMIHTIFYDGNRNADFIRGLGVEFDIPMREQILNRHVRFGGDSGGLWAEPIQPLVGRRVLTYNNTPVYPDQVEGLRVPDAGSYNSQGESLIADWATWSDYRLEQFTPDGFTIQKRTNPQSSWLDAAVGKRANGLAFVGDVSGGLAVVLRNFWQSYPTALEVNNATSDTARLRVWMWSPEAPAMDLRHYDTRAHGLESSYEDVQPGLSTPLGVARTSELMLYPSAVVPSRTTLAADAVLCNAPPLPVASPQYYRSANAFGVWSLVDTTSQGKRWIESQLTGALNQYLREIDQRGWYGFWNYGDVMHAYDNDRHVWRYDIGGYAWDNSELVPDMWLWYSFLRTGRADVFRLAEAMTRHTSEVDCYHLGFLAGLGSRHNVNHWGDGAKENRISAAPLRRFYYYLTADERTGDQMREMLASNETLRTLDPLRVAVPIWSYPANYPTRVRIGPDWFALVGDWYAEWERTGDPQWRDRILAGVASIKAMQYTVFESGGTYFYNPDDYTMIATSPTTPGTQTLTVLMGGPETMFELVGELGSADWSAMWLQYCQLYGAPRSEIQAALGINVSLGGLSSDFARLPAYAGMKTGDPKYATRAWSNLLSDPLIVHQSDGSYTMFRTQRIFPPQVLSAVDEVDNMSTNSVSQWCLNAIELLAMVPADLPESNPVLNGPVAGVNSLNARDLK